MLKSLTFFGQQPASVGGYTLPLGNGVVGAGQLANAAPVQIKDIDGLDPVKADINTVKYALLDGDYLGGTATSKRNIVLKMGLNPDWATQTIETLRLELYNFLMPQQPIKLRFTSTHLPDVEIDGYVEGFEANMFSQDPEMQVSIICPYPYFRAKDVSLISGVTVASHSVDPSDAPTPVEYEGSVAAGFEFTVNKLPTDPGYRGPSSYTGPFAFYVGFTVATFPTVVEAGESLELSAVSLDTGHGIKAITVPGKKGVYKYADTIGDSLLSVMTTSEWASLKPGDNEITVFANDVKEIPWAISYYALYGGL